MQQRPLELDEAEKTIVSCLDVDAPKSFFLYAGAGSGKTRSLVNTLNWLRAESGQRLRLRGQQVTVITYTNAACDEIKRRLEFDPAVAVSTIHSFVWELIRGFNHDIKQWLANDLATEIAELIDLVKKSRTGTKAAVERERSIASKMARLKGLPEIKRFIYSPTGDNRTRDSLNHSEVIKLGACFLTEKPVMRRLLASGSPILFIDESQDTNRVLMDALLAVQAEQRARFGIGLFGDTMQRIYSDGKENLDRSIPADWKTPAKAVNHRCPKRVIRLINQIRSSADAQVQEPGPLAKEGTVRLFIASNMIASRMNCEKAARDVMAKASGDQLWTDEANVKTLILEHHMAATRMGFAEMFEPLASISDYQTSLREGTLPLLRFFSDLVLPVVAASRDGNQFALAAVVRKASPLLNEITLSRSEQPIKQVMAAKSAVEELVRVCEPAAKASFQAVLQCVAKSGLFDIPDALFPFASAEDANLEDGDTDDTGGSESATSTSERITKVRQFLSSPFVQIAAYADYVSGQALFGTHQGVKGLEFPRVLVVMDDEESRGFLFSYEKLFGVKERSKTDLDNQRSGKETSIERTQRLFYVTCSRAEESLALMAYTSNPATLKRQAIERGWFEDDEVKVLA